MLNQNHALQSKRHELARACHDNMILSVKTERKSTHQVLLGIQEMIREKYYLELGYASLFDYLTLFHGYSEGSAQRRISSARMLLEVPEIQPDIEAGKINLTQISKLASAVSQNQKASGEKVGREAKLEILKSISNKNSLQTEQVLAAELNYKPDLKEKIRAAADEYVLTMKLSKEQFAKLQQAQSILSHINHENNYAQFVEILCDKVIQKSNGKGKSQEARQTIKETDVDQSVDTAAAAVRPTRFVETYFASKNNTSSSHSSYEAFRRKYISIHLRREALRRAGHCCEFTSSVTGQRCESTYQLQTDHIKPVSLGGKDELSNFRVLCRAHNLAEARRMGVAL